MLDLCSAWLRNREADGHLAGCSATRSRFQVQVLGLGTGTGTGTGTQALHDYRSLQLYRLQYCSRRVVETVGKSRIASAHGCLCKPPNRLHNKHCKANLNLNHSPQSSSISRCAIHSRLTLIFLSQSFSHPSSASIVNNCNVIHVYLLKY